MKTLNASVILALLTLSPRLVSASLKPRQVPVAKYTLTGYSSTPGTPYPYYNISVLEDGATNPITNPLIVYSISPEAAFLPGPFTPTSNCTFTLEDGTVAYVDSTNDIIPQKVVSVSCVPLPSASSSPDDSLATSMAPPASDATSVVPSASPTSSVASSATASYIVSSVPPPTATGVYPLVGVTGAMYGSATGTGLNPGRTGAGVLTFTGAGAGRVGVGLGGMVGGVLIGARVML